MEKIPGAQHPPSVSFSRSGETFRHSLGLSREWESSSDTMAGPDEDVLGTALDWRREGHKVAIATVVETWGSSPRPRGSQLAAREDGLFLGSVSGGCVEAKVIEAAQRVMRGEEPVVLEFGVSNDEAWEVGLACGGTVRIYVEAVE